MPMKRIPKHLGWRRRRYRAILAYLARAGGRINTTNSARETALHLAVKRNDIEDVAHLLQLGADVNHENGRGETPLQVAVVNGSHADVLAEIIPNSNGILYSRMEFYGLRSLDFAAVGRELDAYNDRSYQLVYTLLNAGASVNIEDYNRCSPLQCEADVTARADQALVGDTALHWASVLNIRNSHDGIIKKLLEFGSNLEEDNYLGRSPFSYIVEHSNVRLIKFCVDEYQEDLIHNALHYAAQNQNEGMMDLVLESGPEINHTCLIHQTPLYLTSRLSMMKNIRKLISLGANVNAKDVRGLTPLAVCY